MELISDFAKGVMVEVVSKLADSTGLVAMADATTETVTEVDEHGAHSTCPVLTLLLHLSDPRSTIASVTACHVPITAHLTCSLPDVVEALWNQARSNLHLRLMGFDEIIEDVMGEGG